MSRLIFISGSYARSKNYQRSSDIDLICLDENIVRIYSETFVVNNVRFQITFMPSYKLADVISADITAPDRIYVNMLEESIPTDANGAKAINEIHDYISYMKNECDRVNDINIYRQLVLIRELCSEISDERNNAVVIASDLLRTLLSFVTELPNTTSKHLGRAVSGNYTATNICTEYIESLKKNDYKKFVKMAISIISQYTADDWKSSTGISYNFPNGSYLTIFIPGCKSRDLAPRHLLEKLKLSCKDAMCYCFYVGNNQFMENGLYLQVRHDKKIPMKELIARLHDCHRKFAGFCIKEDLKIIFPYRTSFDSGYMFGGKAIFNILYPFFCKLYSIAASCNETGIALGLTLCNIWKTKCTDGRTMLENYMDSIALDAVDPNSVYNVIQAGYMRVALKEYYDSVADSDFPPVDMTVNVSMSETIDGMLNMLQKINEDDIHIIRILFQGRKKYTLLTNILNHLLSIFSLDTDEKYAVVHYCLKHDNE